METEPTIPSLCSWLPTRNMYTMCVCVQLSTATESVTMFHYLVWSSEKSRGGEDSKRLIGTFWVHFLFRVSIDNSFDLRFELYP